METVTLNNGVRLPIFGFGVYQVPSEETEEAVTAALNVGYRLLDTAAAYRNEAAVGEAIRVPWSIVQAHDGTLTIAGRPDGGLRVSAVLPTGAVA